jgi:gamma-glutamyltranspeptidase
MQLAGAHFGAAGLPAAGSRPSAATTRSNQPVQGIQMTNRLSAIGGPAAVTTAEAFSTEAATSVLRKGGSAVDALIAAAAVQCVVANGSTTVAGMWISSSYDPRTGQTTNVASKIAPAKDETYDYDMNGLDAWGGRSMPVPGWVGGAYGAWKQGGRLAWSELFEHAIVLADAYACNPSTYIRVRPGLAMPLAARTDEGRAIWMPEGRYIELGEPVRQPALARTFRALAEGGPEAFYEGQFAEDYVATSRRLGGRLTMADMAGWNDRVSVRPVSLIGDYCGSQIAQAGTDAGLSAYALHLADAADIGAMDETEAVYAQVRIMEEVFHATKQYSPETAGQFLDRGYAASRIGEVLSGPLREVSFDLFWANTEVLAVRDADGGTAWLVHSINTSSIFGAGILAGGAYAVRVLSQSHAQTGNLLQPGLSANPALFRDGKPYVVAGSPGWGIMHAPIGFMINLVQRKLDPYAAICAPRFGVPGAMSAGFMPFESHYPPSVFKMLRERGIQYFDCAPSLLTGRLFAIVADGDQVHAVQDARSEDGSVAAFAP